MFSTSPGRERRTPEPVAVPGAASSVTQTTGTSVPEVWRVRGGEAGLLV